MKLVVQKSFGGQFFYISPNPVRKRRLFPIFTASIMGEWFKYDALFASVICNRLALSTQFPVAT